MRVTDRDVGLGQYPTDRSGIDAEVGADGGQRMPGCVQVGGLAGFVDAQLGMSARNRQAAHVFDHRLASIAVAFREIDDRDAGQIVGLELVELFGVETPLVLSWEPLRRALIGRIRSVLEEFPQVNRGARGVGVTSY